MSRGNKGEDGPPYYQDEDVVFPLTRSMSKQPPPRKFELQPDLPRRAGLSFNKRTLEFGSLNNETPSFPIEDSEFPQRPNSTSMGAVSPGTHAYRNAGDQEEEFPIDYRRGKVPKENQKSTLNWITSKWKTQLAFPLFDPNNEMELEKWFEEISPAVIADQPNAVTILNVMTTNTTPEMRVVLQEARQKIYTVNYLEDLADILGEIMFSDSYLMDEFEKNLFNPSRQETVRNAYFKFKNRNQTYGYMCERHHRYVAVGRQQQTSMFLKCIPLTVANKLVLEPGYESKDVYDLYHRALEIENALKRITVQPSVDFDVFPVERTPGVCPRCGVEGNHWAKNCPFKDVECLKCGRTGHTSNACKAAVIKDTAGRDRILIEPKSTTVVTTQRMDNTFPDQVKTVAGVVGRIITQTEKDREKSREQYKLKRQAEGKTVQERQERRVLLIEDLQQEAEDIEEENTNLDENDYESPDS
jgi:hypothetical protein